MKMYSKMGSLNLQETLEGIYMAMIGSVISALIDVLSGSGIFDLKHIGFGALVAGLSYLKYKFWSSPPKEIELPKETTVITKN